MNLPRFLLAADDNRVFVIHTSSPRFIGEVLFNGAWSRAHFKVELFYIEPHQLTGDEYCALIRAAEDYYSMQVRGKPYERRKKRLD